MTLSGTIDAGFEKMTATSPLQMQSGRFGTSNWTISGSEDLGNGLKANFKVSTSFSPDYVGNNSATTPGALADTAGSVTVTSGAAALKTTAAGTPAAAAAQVIGNNDMWVELAGGFGSAKLGRSVDPTFATVQTANGTKGVTGYTSKVNVLDHNGVYIANQVLYTTPVVSGLSAQVSFAPSEETGKKNNTGYSVNYSAGPLSVGFAASSVNATANVPTAAWNTAYVGKTLQVLSGSYDAGVAKLFVTGTNRSENKSSYNLGVSVPMGAGKVWADYTNNNNTDAIATQLGYQYSLSKRTTAYVQYGNKKVAGTSSNGYGLGVAHNF